MLGGERFVSSVSPDDLECEPRRFRASSLSYQKYKLNAIEKVASISQAESTGKQKTSLDEISFKV